MDIFIVIIILFFISTLLYLGFKNRHKNGGKSFIVMLILLSSSSVLIALTLNSMYSLVFYALQLVLLLLALIFAVKARSMSKG